MEIIDHKLIVPSTNWVLIKPDEEIEKYHLDGKETSIYVGKSYMKYVDELDSLDFEMKETVDTHSQHWPISGTVICAPKRIVYNGHEIHKYKKGIPADGYTPDDLKKCRAMADASAKCQTNVEVKEGEQVFFDYMVTMLAYQEGMYFNTDIGTLILVKYDNLIGKFLEDKTAYPLNGNIFFEWNKNKTIGSFHATEVEIYEAKGVQWGTVTHVGQNLRYFLHGSQFIDCPTEFQIGEKIMFQPQFCTLIESQLHLSIFDGKEIYTIKRHEVLAKE